MAGKVLTALEHLPRFRAVPRHAAAGFGLHIDYVQLRGAVRRGMTAQPTD